MRPDLTTTLVFCSKPRVRIVVSTLFAASAVTLFLPSRCSGLAQSTASLERKAVILRSAASAAIIIEAVNHLEEENWWERLEVHVRNVSCKPIYFLEVDINCPDIVTTEIDGARRTLVIPLIYGRAELMKRGSRAGSDDKPILSGGHHVLKIPSEFSESPEKLAVVKRVSIRVYSLSFGDDTGFKTGGDVFPYQN